MRQPGGPPTTTCRPSSRLRDQLKTVAEDAKQIANETRKNVDERLPKPATAAKKVTPVKKAAARKAGGSLMDDTGRRLVRGTAEILVIVLEESDATPAEQDAIAAARGILIEIGQ